MPEENVINCCHILPSSMQSGIRADDAAKGLLPIIKMWRHVGILSLVCYGWLGVFWEGLLP